MSWLFAVVVLAALVSSVRTVCNTPLPTSSYVLIPPPVDFEGNNTEGQGCTVTSDVANCQGSAVSGTSILVDGETGGSALNISAVHAWNEDISIPISLVSGSRVRQADLYFYNIPSQGIGLPFVEIYWSNSNRNLPTSYLKHTILDNENLSQDDNGLTRVTLAVTTNVADLPNYVFFRIQFRFSEESSINWLLLSEVQLCTTMVTVSNDDISLVEEDESMTFGPSPIVSTLTLSCTVSNEGLFQWEWTVPSVNVQYQMRLANANRTSIIEISQISAMNGYAGNYICQAMYNPLGVPQTSQPGAPMSRTVTLDLQDVLESDENVVEVSSDEPFAILVCEVYGYLSEAPRIQWQYRNNILTNDETYTITEQEGNNTIESSGQLTPSLRSYLNVSTLGTNDINGDYICQADGIGGVITVTLRVTNTPDTTPTTPPTTALPAQQSDSTGIIIGVVVAVLGAAVVVIFVVVIVCCYVRRRNKSGSMHFGSDIDSKQYGSDEPFYQELNKPAPPPIPSRFKQPNNMHTGAYATIGNIGGNGHIELMDVNHQRISVSSAPSIPDENPVPVQLKHQPDFLQNNPLYASADHLDLGTDAPLFPNRRRMGSNPSLDLAEDAHGSMLNIYAQPSRVAPPIPNRPSTPTLLGGPIYSEAAINPALFRQQQQQRAAQSPPDDNLHPYASIYDDPRPLLQSEGPLEVHPSNIHTLKNLGMGQFGQVILAETVGLSLKDLKMSDSNDDKNITVLVAVKTLKIDADKGIKEAFEKEIQFMTRLGDNNVVRLLGICSSGNPFILMEYMENGDLNQYLQKHEEAALDGSPAEDNQLLPSTLLYMSVQMASGMKYLAKRHFVHRDLATRNCLVGRNSEIKIADFGMSRSLYSSYYYRIRGRAMLPIRWMANECFYGKFSEKTDIWAFGVSMWEIFTFAKKQPYEGMTDQQVIDDAVRGCDRQILAKPEYCPEEIYEVMTRCWVYETAERANFDEVHSSLSALHDYSDIP